MEREVGRAIVEAAHPDWKDLTGRPGEDTKFRRWLTKQPAFYQELMDKTMDPALVIDCISRFKKKQNLRWK